MFLINAVYFKGQWQRDPKGSLPKNSLSFDGRPKEVRADDGAIGQLSLPSRR